MLTFSKAQQISFRTEWKMLSQHKLSMKSTLLTHNNSKEEFVQKRLIVDYPLQFSIT